MEQHQSITVNIQKNWQTRMHRIRRMTDSFSRALLFIKKGRLQADRDTPCLDWSHWAIIVREDMPEELAHTITAVMVEERSELEARYRHLPREPRSIQELNVTIERRAYMSQL